MGENVPGLFSSNDGDFFGGILSDLAALGYVVGWCCYGAVDVGALHRRDRVFIVAHAEHNGLLTPKIRRGIRARGYDSTTGQNTACELAGLCQPESVADALDTGLQGSERAGSLRQERQAAECGEVAYSESEQSQSIESGLFEGRLSRQLGRESGDGTANSEGQFKPGLGDMADGFSSEMARYMSNEPDIPRVATGIKDRVNKLKALGNAVVPAQIYPIYKAIVDIENNMGVNG